MTAPGDTVQVDLTGLQALDGASITLRNSGFAPITFPQISNPGSAWPYSADAIIQQIQPTGSDQDKAIEVWQYVIGHTFHFCAAGTRSQTRTDYTADPVLLLNGFGFGCCDQLAPALAWLWQKLGFQVRVAVMNFHTAPEVFYGSGWHMLDPDRQTYYLGNDNQTIASVADIIADPSIVARTLIDPLGDDQVAWAQLYTENASTLHYYSQFTDLGLSLSLRPHEQLRIDSLNRTDLTQIYDFPDPNPYFPLTLGAVNSGQFDWDLSFGDQAWQAQAHAVEGADVIPDPSGAAYLTATSSAPGSVIYQESSVFPVLGLLLAAQTAPGGGTLNAYFSSDAVNWAGPVAFTDTADLSSYQKYADLSIQAQGSYSYFIKVELQNGARLRKLRISPVVQVSRFLFPGLALSANQLVYTDTSPLTQTRAVKIVTRIPGGSPVIKGLQASSLLPEDLFRSLAQDHSASNLVDGDPDSYAGGSNQLNYGVQLNGLYRVKAVSIDWDEFGTDPRYVKSWTLFGRNGSQPWQSLASSGFPGHSTSTVTLDFEATELRIEAEGPNPIGIYELRAFGALLQPLKASFTEASSGSGWILQAANGATATSQLPADGSVDPGILRTFTMERRAAFAVQTHLSAAQINWTALGAKASAVQSWALMARNGSDQPWMTLAQGTSASAETLLDIDCVATEVRAVATSALAWTRAYDVDLYGSPLLTNVSAAPDEFVEQPGVSGYGQAANLVDGNLDTFAYPGLSSLDYLHDPGQTTAIDAVKLVWGAFGTNSIYLSSWQLLGLPEGSATWQEIRRGTFPDASETTVPVQGRYRKLRIAAQSSALNWIGIYEVQIFGTPVTAATTPPVVAIPIARSQKANSNSAPLHNGNTVRPSGKVATSQKANSNSAPAPIVPLHPWAGSPSGLNSRIRNVN